MIEDVTGCVKWESSNLWLYNGEINEWMDWDFPEAFKRTHFVKNSWSPIDEPINVDDNFSLGHVCGCGGEKLWWTEIQNSGTSRHNVK